MILNPAYVWITFRVVFKIIYRIKRDLITFIERVRHNTLLCTILLRYVIDSSNGKP